MLFSRYAALQLSVQPVPLSGQLLQRRLVGLQPRPQLGRRPLLLRQVSAQLRLWRGTGQDAVTAEGSSHMDSVIYII